MQVTPQVPHLDLYTVKVMTLLTALVVSTATVLAWRINRRSRGMRLFAMGLAAIAVGALLGIARVVIPGLFVLFACNAFMFGGMVMVANGVRVFREWEPWRGPALITLCTVVSVPYFYWLLIQENFGMRVAVMSASYSFMCADAALSMFREAPSRARITYWPTALSFTFAAGYLAARAIGGWSGAYGASLFVGSPGIELIATLSANVAYTGCAVGMILASNTQLWQQAERVALLDPLTGLPNRRYFLDYLLAAESRSIATGTQLGIIYLDLDGFKAVNDRLGHAAGDTLLQRVGTAMVRVIRAGDCAARLGGDEFVVLAERLESREQLGTLAQRLKQAIEKDPVPGTDHEPVRVSLGMAVFPLDGRSAHDAMREADAAMYLSKRRSRFASVST